MHNYSLPNWLIISGLFPIADTQRYSICLRVIQQETGTRRQLKKRDPEHWEQMVSHTSKV